MDEPNQLWVADITYVQTWAGFIYLSDVPDAFSRRIVGWAMGHDLKAQLVIPSRASLRDTLPGSGRHEHGNRSAATDKRHPP